MTAALMESELDLDKTYRIDVCEHRWWRPWWSRLLRIKRARCLAHCGAVLEGTLAQNPPRSGMDWERAALVTRS